MPVVAATGRLKFVLALPVTLRLALPNRRHLQPECRIGPKQAAPSRQAMFVVALNYCLYAAAKAEGRHHCYYCCLLEAPSAKASFKHLGMAY